MIRILHLPGTVSLKNGRMHVIMNIYRKIDKSKFQFDFLVTDMEEESFIDEIHSLGGKVYTVRKNQRNNFFILFRKLQNVLKQNDYKIIHYHATSQWGTVLFGLKKTNVEQVIIHSHATVYSDSVIKSIRNFIMSLPIFFSGTKFIAVTYEAGKGIFLRKKFKVIPNSIDTEKFKYNEQNRQIVRQRINIKNNAIVLGNVGRYSKQKSQLRLIEIFFDILKMDTNNTWILLLIGQGKLKKQLMDKTSQLGIEHKVILLHTQSDIDQYYSAMDIFCFPSTYEGFGMAALEAQSNGLPVALSDVIPDAVKFENSFEMSLSDSNKDWARKIIEISRYTVKRSDGKLLIEKAHMDSANVVRQWEEMYILSNYGK